MLNIEELDYQKTELGELILRRRKSPSYGDDWIYEVTIDGEFLMSSVVNASEIALSRMALAPFGAGATCSDGGRELRVLVGGLGLGYTAIAALENPSVGSVVVLELLAPVISWHEKRLVPGAAQLMEDPRVSLMQADFFTTMEKPPEDFGVFDAILLDLDHSPDALLHSRHGSFYDAEGPAHIARLLSEDGVFALWSADAPDNCFIEHLRSSFAAVDEEGLTFDVPHLDMEDVNTLVFAWKKSPAQ